MGRVRVVPTIYTGITLLLVWLAFSLVGKYMIPAVGARDKTRMRC